MMRLKRKKMLVQKSWEQKQKEKAEIESQRANRPRTKRIESNKEIKKAGEACGVIQW